MTSNFDITLYLTKCATYQFAYPIGSNEQVNNVLQAELKLTNEEYQSYEPNFKTLNLYDKVQFLKTLNEADFAVISESYQCREVALNKGYDYFIWRTGLNMVYRDSLLELTYPHQIPAPFKELLTTTILNRYAVNKPLSHIWCDLDNDYFAIAMNPGCWNKGWLGLLTYFAKYGEFMWEISDTSYNEHFSLDQAIHAVLDSWSGQVGYYTALGLWLWGTDDSIAIHSYYPQADGIHNAMDNYTTLYAPDSLLEFSVKYGLGLSRVSRLYLNNHRARCEAVGLSIPSWYDNGCDNDQNLADSPEWFDYMGYSDEDSDEFRDEYDDEDNYDFEEEDW